MQTLWKQRQTLEDENTKLVLEWLALLEGPERYSVIRGMVARYSIAELKLSNAHMRGEISRAKAKGGDA